MTHRIQAVAARSLTVLFFLALGQARTAEPEKMIRITGRVVGRVAAVGNFPLTRTTVTLSVQGSATPTRSILTDTDGNFALLSVASLASELRFEERGFKSITIRLAKDTMSQDVEMGTVILQVVEVTEGPFFSVKAPKKIKPLTVCEVLADLKRLSGKTIAIVGRLDCSWSLTDHTCHLTEDRCDRPVTTQGFVWPNTILLMDHWEEGMPKPPNDNLEIESSAIFEKLSFISKTTLLGLHKEPVFRTKDRTISFSQMAEVKDWWGATFGRLLTTPKLKKDGCGDDLGCGGFDGTPAALITTLESLRTYDENGIQAHRTKR